MEEISAIFQKIKKNLDKAFEVAQIREKTATQPEPTLDERIDKAKAAVEKRIEATNYDRSGIEPKYWEFITQLAAERLVATETKIQAVGRITKESVGFMLMGKPRAGKTFLMRILAGINAIPIPVGEATIKNDYQAGGLDRLFNTYPAIRSKDFTFDDLGIVGDVKNYGNSEIINSLLFERYECWQSHGACATFISTNLESYTDIKEHYGVQLANRIADMCVLITVQGQNRGLSANKRFFH